MRFAAAHESGDGPSRHFAVAQNLRRFESQVDIGFDGSRLARAFD